MEPIDDFENIKFPYVSEVKYTLLWDDIGTISGEERLRKMIYILRKTHDDFNRHYNREFHGYTNKKIHEKEK
jgi:hypothetical protein